MSSPAADSPHAPAVDPARDVYQARRDRFAAEESRLESRSLLFSGARLVTATAGLALFLAVIVRASVDPAPWLWGLVATVVGFVGLVVVHERVVREKDRWRERREIQEEGLARLDRRWDDLPIPAAAPPASRRALSRDLQLFGRASLFHLLGTQSPPGREALARWLLEPASPEAVESRQRVARALVPALGFRHELALEGRRLADLAPEVEPFLAWAEGRGWLRRRPAWVWTSRLLPASAWTAAALAALGLAPVQLPLVLFTLSFGVANLVARKVEVEHDRVAAREREMEAYAAALSLLWSPEAEAVDPLTLDDLRHDLEADGESAPQHLRRLQRLTDLADARRSGALRFVLGTLFLWDLHTLWWLERWQARVGLGARRWLERLGELEAASAFAGLAFEEPGWSFPILDPAVDSIEAAGLAHPLLPADRRVANDVSLGPPGSALFVTGSNMSGKSTLLRALGVNLVLAQAGAPVCAGRLTLPPVELATSVLVEDSLEEGLSFFMAEVLRVRDVVAAGEEAARQGRRLVFLLDEILRGTNSADRRVAVREVLQRLLDLGAIGAVSTHDLGLAEEPELRGVLVPVHFREELHPDADPGEPAMTFDYRLRPGVAPTTNALRLLEMFGLS